MSVYSSEVSIPESEIKYNLKTLLVIGSPIKPTCYITDESDIGGVCHECGRPLNLSNEGYEKDNGFRQRLAKRISIYNKNTLWNKITNFFDRILLFKNQEFTGLALDPNTSIHCEYCTHNVRFPLFCWLLSIIFLGIFVVIVFIQPITFLGYLALGTILGIVLITLQYIGHARFQKHLIQKTPPFPLLGRAITITVEESLNGELCLNDEGQYLVQSKIDACYGKLTYSLIVTPADKARLNKYWQKFGLSTPYFQLLAGFLLFQNVRALHFLNNHLIPGRTNTLRIRGSEKKEKWSRTDETLSWERSAHYKIYLSSEEEQLLPVQIFPTIISEGSHTALELTVQVNPNLWNKALLKADVEVKNLELYPLEPHQLGAIQHAHPPSLPELEGTRCCWKKIKLQTFPEQAFYEHFDDSSIGIPPIPSKRFYIRYESSVSQSMVFKGKLTALFKDTISGIDNIELYDPLGYKVDKEKEVLSVKRQTEISVDFEFDLHSLCIRNHTTEEANITEDVIPDYLLVNKLVSKLASDRQTYIQRVIENPPHTNRANAKITNRFWDIAGRQYIGVFPIDFHLVLTGHEKFSDTDKADAGHTKFEVKVYATTTNNDMAEKVKELSYRIKQIIRESTSANNSSNQEDGFASNGYS